MSPKVLPLVVVNDGPTFLTVDESVEQRIAKEAFAVQWRYIHGRATPDELISFLGLRVAGRLVEVNPDRLEDWARRGEFDLAEVYRELFS